MSPNSFEQFTKYDYFVSLGYRCSSAGILKSLGIKQESYPFDWMVSRLPVIEHCIQNEFAEFLNTTNYKCVQGMTNHYSSLDTSSRQWICNESICFNEYYETSTSQLSNIDLYLPKPINPEYDAYGYKLMMNHRNIKRTKEDEEYFARCVERWNRIRISPTANILHLYIHPAIFYDEFFSIEKLLLEHFEKQQYTKGFIVIKAPKKALRITDSVQAKDYALNVFSQTIPAVKYDFMIEKIFTSQKDLDNYKFTALKPILPRRFIRPVMLMSLDLHYAHRIKNDPPL
jgi:hypothetical protein